MDISVTLCYFCCMKSDYVGTKIKMAREYSGNSRTEFAKKIGASYDQLRQWELGIRNPKYEALTKIATASDIDLEYFTNEHAHPTMLQYYTTDYIADAYSNDKTIMLSSENQDYLTDLQMIYGMNLSSLTNMILDEYRYANPRRNENGEVIDKKIEYDIK